MRTIIFNIKTEYHLLFAIKMISLLYDIKEDRVIIVRASPYGSKRLNGTFNYENTGIEYREHIYSRDNFKEKNLKHKLDELIEIRPDVFVLFNEHEPWYDYLLPKLKRINTTIVMAPDGTGAYYHHYDLRGRISHTIHANFYLLSNGFWTLSPLQGKYYAYHHEIDYVAIEDLKAFKNPTNKKVLSISKPNEDQEKVIIDLSNHIFGFDKDKQMVSPGSILWLDDPEELLVKQKYAFLSELKKKYPSTRIFVKPHPRSYKDEIDSFEQELGFEIVRTKFPAELIIQNLHNVCIISIFSTAMFCYNSTCKYYCIFPMYKEITGFAPAEIPFDYINTVTDIHQISIVE